MSDREPGRETVPRVMLAVLAGLDLFSFVFFLRDARTNALADGAALNWFVDAVSSSFGRTSIAALGIAGAVAFGRRPGRLLAGLLALAALMACSTAHAHLFGSPWRHLYFSGLCLAGWLAGLLVSRRRGHPADESFARVGALALLAAAYLNGGVSKLVYSGLDWLSGAPIQAIVVAQDGLVPGGFLGQVRLWAVMTPIIAAGFSIGTVLLELAAPLMLAGGRVRRLVAAGLLVMHASIFVLTGIIYWEGMVLLTVLGFWPDAPSAVAATPSPAGDRRFAVAAGVLLVCLLGVVAHQARRYADVQAARVAAMAATPAPAPANTGPQAIARLGPFTVGQSLTDAWAIDALELTADGIVARTAGQRGRVAFEVTCAASSRRARSTSTGRTSSIRAISPRRTSSPPAWRCSSACARPPAPTSARRWRSGARRHRQRRFQARRRVFRCAGAAVCPRRFRHAPQDCTLTLEVWRS